MFKLEMNKGLLALASCLFSYHLQAAPIVINNFGFEDDFVPDGNFQVFLPSGWDLFDPNGITGGGNAVGAINSNNNDFFPGGVTEGNNAALVFLSNPSTPGLAMGLSQTLTATLQPNTSYTLSVDIGNIASGTGLPPSDQFGFFNLEGFPGYQVQLFAGSTLLAEDNNLLFGSIAEGTFETSTINFISGATHVALNEQLQIRLINLNLVGTPAEPGIEVDFDNVLLDAVVVPLPPAVVLFMAASSCLLFFRRKRISVIT
jgi:hapalindole H/12-epi-hapalindole U/12-epi-fischerindole U/hapalindole U synthase